MQPIIYQGVATLSFLQLDRLNGLPKGSAFRAFKAVRTELCEGRDYFYLDGGEHGAWIEQLREQGCVYAGSPNLVLITREGYARMRGDGEG